MVADNEFTRSPPKPPKTPEEIGVTAENLYRKIKEVDALRQKKQSLARLETQLNRDVKNNAHALETAEAELMKLYDIFTGK